jgi:hypothetical protein
VKKLAIFVEGQTEQLFVDKLISEIVGNNSIVIENHRITSGSRSIYQWVRLCASRPDQGCGFFVLIIDCSGDSTVKSYIRDNYESLVSNGYSAIIGIRDVFPKVEYANIAKLRLGLKYGLKTNPIRALFVLGVMEIETWFISEHTHFARVNPALTSTHIKDNLGFDPSADDIQLRPNPSADLDSIYKLVGMRYKKDYQRIQRLLSQLDYALLYCDIRNRLPDLNALIESIDTFFTP